MHRCIHQAKLTRFNSYGFKAAFNPSHPGEAGNPYGFWVSPWHFGLNQGPSVLMIENHRSGRMKSCPYVASGLKRAGFTSPSARFDAGHAAPTLRSRRWP
jgi:hypothetical protein